MGFNWGRRHVSPKLNALVRTDPEFHTLLRETSPLMGVWRWLKFRLLSGHSVDKYVKSKRSVSRSADSGNRIQFIFKPK